MTPAERFWSKVDTTPTIHQCWIWTAFKSKGYGKFRVGTAVKPAHRVAYEMLVGPIPEGLVVDHLCRNRASVNPDHLRVCTNAENTSADGSLAPTKLNSEKTHCPQGHPYSGENLYVNPRGERECRECHRQRKRRRKAEMKAARLSPPAPTTQENT